MGYGDGYVGTYSGNAETDKPSPKADTRHISIPTHQQVRVVAEAEMAFYPGHSSPSAYLQWGRITVCDYIWRP